MPKLQSKVVVAVPTFKSTLHTMFYEQLRKLLPPEEMSLRSVSGEPDVQKEHLLRALEQVKPTALIAIDVRPDEEVIEEYRLNDAPIILVDDEIPGVCTITVDNYEGGRIAGEYLIKIGRRKLSIVSGRTNVAGGFNAAERLRGFQDALAEAKLSLSLGCRIEVVNYSREDGIEVMPKLISMNVDGIFCAAGDNCAVGLVTVAKEKGIRIPEDIAIIGFDDLLIAQLSNPKLTTIRQPVVEMAEMAYELAVKKREESLRAPKQVVFKPELVQRQSA